MEALIDWHLAQVPQNPPVVIAAGEARYALGQLAWVHAVGMFQSDMARDMLALGINGGAAHELTQAAVAHGTVIGVWKACVQRHAVALETYLAKCLESYRASWPHFPGADKSSADEAAEGPVLGGQAF
ncbi:hypothetical protein [Massilia phyllosphaerae]|uniref:hypothetical protein n=1 Tax=Massilia phyllosphaerae TaxID=3106034 RepID=UPI002B1CC9D5|nr:hypothetical protein [Massilia sp. SGZ-792]